MNLSALKKLQQLRTSSQGFTLIELLVVIGILGILAAALIATIDPFEQLKKAQDANTKNAVVEFVNANIRYYTTHSSMPWGDTANTSTYATNCATVATGGVIAGATLNSMTASCLGALVNDGELKTTFTLATNILTNIIISGGTNTVTACFQPVSRSERNNANTKFNSTGVTLAGCPNATSSLCYYCSQ